ncbi:hypothetical protein SKAU_G00197860 [Synaphobranchus kaupii]|uniref:RING-type domain-containing protein n=1 Tax=Synaphobranchus kaupii TaxID=118154 RepID=A0A9Q1IVU6_SYNKA|nr:hypothetical protein SKAU_G00197860 [Synaphobranchus kaupii]
MVECEDNMECGVCYQAYTRWERVPRLLHCGHALCTLCLKQMSQSMSSLLAVRCPFCRWTTCVGPNLSLQEGLWVHAKLWDQISECEEESESEEEEEEKEKGEEQEQARPTQLTQQPKWPSLERYRLHLQVPAVLRRFSGRLQRTFRHGHQTSCKS